MAKKSLDPNSELGTQILDCLPGNSIDCVIFGYDDQELKILLLQWKHEKIWSLPGGFIYKEEGLNEAAHRILSVRTRLDSIFLNQFHTFGSKNRSKVDDEVQAKRRILLIKHFHGEHTDIIHWLEKRFITTGYFALVDITKTSPKPDLLSEKCEWRSIQSMPPLIMDHHEIVQKALQKLRIQLNHLPVGLSILPDRFTMQDLQKLYETILQKPLERSNFQRKILKLKVLIRHEKQMGGGAHRAPYLYSFNEVRYNELLKNRIGFL